MISTHLRLSRYCLPHTATHHHQPESPKMVRLSLLVTLYSPLKLSRFTSDVIFIYLFILAAVQEVRGDREGRPRQLRQRIRQARRHRRCLRSEQSMLSQFLSVFSNFLLNNYIKNNNLMPYFFLPLYVLLVQYFFLLSYFKIHYISCQCLVGFLSKQFIRA